MLPTSRTATLVVNPFVATVLYTVSLVVGHVLEQYYPHWSSVAQMHTTVSNYDGPIIFVAGILTCAAIVFALVWVRLSVRDNQKQLTWTMNLEANDWSTIGTWVAQFGVIAGAFTAILTQQPSLLPDAGQGPTHFVALAILFGVTTVVAPLLYALTCLPTVPNTVVTGDQVAKGWSLCFIISLGLILFAALGQLGLGFAYISAMRAYGTLVDVVAVPLLCQIGIGYLVISIAVIRTMRLYLDQFATEAASQPTTGEEAMRQGQPSPGASTL